MFITLSARRTLITLLSIAAVFVLIHLATQYYLFDAKVPWPSTTYEALDRFSVDGEVNIATWFSQIIIFAAALLFFAISCAKKDAKQGWLSWGSLGVIFTYLSIDEGAALHELTVTPFRTQLDIQGGFLLSAWVVPFAVLTLIFVLAYLKFWLKLPARTRWLMALAGCLYVGGALILEMIGAHIYTAAGGEASFPNAIQSGIEEGLEMTGIAVLIYALLDYIHTMPHKFFTAIKITA